MNTKKMAVLWSLVSGLLVAASISAAAVTEIAIGDKRRVSFDSDWRFNKGEAPGAEAPAFDDAAWRVLDLPHDWAIEGPFDRAINPHAGALPYFGVGWYRKHFTLPEAARGRFFSLELDGAMSNARVYLNGQVIGGRPYGYIGFAVDLTPYLRFGVEENVLAVRLAPEDQSSRWYPGAGIYRHVWLDVTGAVHVARWGTYVTTPSVTDALATVDVKTEIRNRNAEPVSVTVETLVLDAAGKTVASTATAATIPAHATHVVPAQVQVATPVRWDVTHPYVYGVISVVKDGARTLDRHVTPFGIRTIGFDKVKGFLLNGRPLKMQGVCMHHDLGALGTAIHRRALERQLEILKRMGVNAIRTSHNPPAPELLDLCDQMGLLVMDEAFDMWHRPKVVNGHGKYFNEWGDIDLTDMLRRDRNHPSIVLWSIGNEINEQADADGWKVARRLTAICHAQDPTRPVTAGFNQSANAIKNKLADEVDIPGFNYKPFEYEQILRDHPEWIIVGAESSSCVSSRGVYHLPISKYEKHESLQLSSYDIIAPRWAYAPDVELDAQDRLPQVLGEFVWTGFDYLGEPTPYFNSRPPAVDNDWPARSSYFGAIDLAGFPKDRFYLYQSVWTKEPMVHLLPHWNWAGREGQAIPVFVYTNADEVQLFLNGKSLGRKRRFSEPVEIPVGQNVTPTLKFKSKYRLAWQVPFMPGTLRAVAYKGGRVVASTEVRTAGEPARLVLSPDRSALAADGEDLSFITVRVEDKNGNFCPLADSLVRFKVEGAATLAAVDNGNAATAESFQAAERKAFNGLALLIVKTQRGQAGSVHVTATSEGLTPAEATLTTQAR